MIFLEGRAEAGRYGEVCSYLRPGQIFHGFPAPCGLGPLLGCLEELLDTQKNQNGKAYLAAAY